MNILISICARKGSKGLPSKNIREVAGKPLIVHTIELALKWSGSGVKNKRVVVSTDCEKIAEVAKKAGAEVPFLRPAELATDSIGKMPVLLHAFKTAQESFKEAYDCLVDLDPTSPLRTLGDLDAGWEKFKSSKPDVVFSVTRARKNPYFNMVEQQDDGQAKLVKSLDGVHSRQAAPKVYDMNASVYIYDKNFLLSDPKTLWEGKTNFFEMPPESAFDIDLERDLVVTEALMKFVEGAKKGT